MNVCVFSRLPLLSSIKRNGRAVGVVHVFPSLPPSNDVRVCNCFYFALDHSSKLLVFCCCFMCHSAMSTNPAGPFRRTKKKTTTTTATRTPPLFPAIWALIGRRVGGKVAEWVGLVSSVSQSPAHRVPATVKVTPMTVELEYPLAPSL